MSAKYLVNEFGMKARDIVPGWPRGRSTERFRRHHAAREHAAGDDIWSTWRFHDSAEFGMAVRLEIAENTRKDAMMALWYASRMNEAAGDVADERRRRFRVEAFGVSSWVGWRTVVLFRERLEMLWWPGRPMHCVSSDMQGRLIFRWNEERS